jgi:hypothetical protein
MEIVAKISQKSIIEYNKEEIEKELKVIEEKYTGLTFTEEQLGEAKEERAKLNKLVKGLGDYRKSIVKEAMTEIEPFENFMKEAEKRAKNLSESIDAQAKKFEENLKIERLAKVTEYLENLLEENPQYAEFKQQLAPSMDNAVFINKGSFNAKNEVGSKIIEFINAQLSQFDEIIAARKAQEELLQQKRELIVSQCVSVSEMLGLKMPLTAKQFAYLKDYDLSKITDEITRAGKEQAEKERIAIEKIQKEADEKARIEAEKKILEESKIEEVKESINNQSEPQKEVLDVEIVQEPIKEVKTSQKLFYGVLEFEGITISEATAFRKFLDENGIKFKTIKSEVK